MKKRDWQDYKGVLGGLRHTKAFPSGGTHTWEGPGEHHCVKVRVTKKKKNHST